MWTNTKKKETSSHFFARFKISGPNTRLSNLTPMPFLQRFTESNFRVITYIQIRAETANDHVYPRFSSCSFSCRQTPVRLAAIRFPGRSLTGQAPPRAPLPPPPPPPSAARLTRTGSWRAAGRSWTQRWGCTALPTPPRPPPARTTPTTSPTAPTHPLSTPLWWAHFSLIWCSNGGEGGSGWSINRVLFINLSHNANMSALTSRLIQHPVSNASLRTS